MIFIFVAGYAIEVRVKTGKIFGHTYGKTLGFKVAIGSNWVIMVLTVAWIVTLTGVGRVLGSLLAAVIMTSSDIFKASRHLKRHVVLNLTGRSISFIFCLLAYPSIAGMQKGGHPWIFISIGPISPDTSNSQIVFGHNPIENIFLFIRPFSGCTPRGQEAFSPGLCGD